MIKTLSRLRAIVPALWPETVIAIRIELGNALNRVVGSGYGLTRKPPVQQNVSRLQKVVGACSDLLRG
jgi:hypothetical protein